MSRISNKSNSKRNWHEQHQPKTVVSKKERTEVNTTARRLARTALASAKTSNNKEQTETKRVGKQQQQQETSSIRKQKTTKENDRPVAVTAKTTVSKKTEANR